MSKPEEVKLNVKFVTNKQKNKVLFAEAGSDFTDVLLSFLLLPLGMIVKVLQKHNGDKASVFGSLNTLYNGDKASVFGSLNALYNGVANLDSSHFQTEAAKQKLLISTSCYDVESRKLRLNVNYPTNSSPNSVKKYDGVFTDSAASFIISDDLRVMNNVSGSFMETLSSLGITATDMNVYETRVVAFGFKEILSLLKLSLVSQNPLSSLLLSSSPKGFTSAKFEQGNASLPCLDEKVVSMNSKKMILKVMMQKDTNKLLFAQADYDFVNFLFGLLMIPLGRVEWYLGSNTCLKTLDNLHKSIAGVSSKVDLKSTQVKMLLTTSDTLVSPNEFSRLNFDPDANNHLVRGIRKYIVSDDLTVVPLGMTLCLAIIDGFMLTVSDVEELEVQVGLEEGLSILKAALTSTTALTDGLLEPLLKKQVREKEKQSGVKEMPKKRPKLEY